MLDQVSSTSKGFGGPTRQLSRESFKQTASVPSFNHRSKNCLHLSLRPLKADRTADRTAFPLVGGDKAAH